MNTFRLKRVKVALASVLGLAVIALAATIAASSTVGAHESGGYGDAGSLEGLASARGIVADWAETTDGRTWTIVGEWTLDCDRACTDVHPTRIDFDMAFSMYREDLKSQDNQSHGHPFWDFSATSVTLVNHTLIIEGDIMGSGGIGDVGITIKLRQHSNHFTFSFSLDDDNSIATEVSGVVVESKGR